MVSDSKRTGHYVVSTHWDREWYEPFQHYRFRLVNLLDEVLDTLERTPEFRYFQMDGQSIPAEDYLEIRPERAEQFRSLVAAGRLRLGPWYVLPDEALVSGESIVRNLQRGIAVAAQFGRPSRVGFLCDMFGHISQLPQILRGFGIDNAFLWRGVNEDTHGAMFRWQAPDGSEVLAYRFSPRGGYCSYAFKVRRSEIPDVVFDQEEALKGLAEYLEFETGRCPTSSFLVFDGGDHLEIEPQTAEFLKTANRQLEEVELVHSHLEGFVEDLREQRDRITQTFVGELREPALQGDDQWLIPGVLSSRIHLKQANARCENELCLWAEPFSAFAALLGEDYPQSYLDLAWRYLLQNHPHDSICGCSIDQVHRDMVYRFDQSHLIATRLTGQALRRIADRVQVPDLGEQDLALLVFNPSSEAIDGPVDVTIRFKSDVDAKYQEWFGFEEKIGFRLYDASGQEIPYQYVNQRKDRIGFSRSLRKFPAGEKRHEVDVTARLQVPAFGYTTLVCRPVKEPTRHDGSMLVDDHTIENENLIVSVNPNGTLHLVDKESGEAYDNLLTLEDRADIGDGWYHGTAVNDRIQSSVASAADVALTADGPHKATLTIRVVMHVPRHFRFDRMVRSEQVAPLVVTHLVTLRQGADCVEVRTDVENTIRDHRLRVLFPSGAQGETYLSDQAFDVVERPIALREDNARYKEPEVETKPQQTWTAVHDDQRGLAVISAGLPEAAVRDLPDRPIALTLLRSFVRAVLTSGNEGGEIQGKHRFEYRILPLAGRPDVSRLTRLGQSLAGGVRVVQLEPKDISPDHTPGSPRNRRTLAPVHGLMEIDHGQAVVSAVQRDCGGSATVVRLFNPTTQETQSQLSIPGTQGDVQFTDLEGNAGDALPRQGEQVRIELAPKRIVTVSIED
jgi:alpha-mannosidase/mannosylglycerate hydrolase